MPDRPKFLEKSLQGLAFWIGHRRAYYDGYPLSEAALVSEACNLIQANIDSNIQKLCPEVMYKRLIDIKESKISEKSRADLVILNPDAPDPYKKFAGDSVQYVLEVKKANAEDALITKDLQRLYYFKKASRKEARAFLIVAGESKLPDRFVHSEKGVAKKGRHKIPDTDGVYHVRRVVKAASSYDNKESAHYVCIIEVFSEPPEKLKERYPL